MDRGRASARRRVHPYAERERRAGMTGFSFRRLFALLRKEAIQVRRDRDDAAHHHRHTDHAGVPVRLCDQRRPQTPADGIAEQRAFEIRAHHCRRADQFGLLRHPAARQRSRGGGGPGGRRIVVCDQYSARLRPGGRPRRIPLDPDRRRRDRSDGDRQRDGGAGLARRPTCNAICRRSAGASRRRRRSSSSFTPATIPSN